MDSPKDVPETMRRPQPESPSPRTNKFQRHRPPPISTSNHFLESPMPSPGTSLPSDAESTVSVEPYNQRPSGFEPYETMIPILFFPLDDQKEMKYYFRPWKTRLFDCFKDIKSCLLTMLFPCITFPQLIEIINEGQTPWWENGIVCTWTAYKTFGYSAILYIWLYRLKMRHKYNLKGNHMWDCFLTHCCCYLVICQMQRELQSYGFQLSIGWQANLEKHGEVIQKYQMQREMEVWEAWRASCQAPPIVPEGMFRS